MSVSKTGCLKRWVERIVTATHLDLSFVQGYYQATELYWHGSMLTLHSSEQRDDIHLMH